MEPVICRGGAVYGLGSPQRVESGVYANADDVGLHYCGVERAESGIYANPGMQRAERVRSASNVSVLVLASFFGRLRQLVPHERHLRWPFCTHLRQSEYLNRTITV